jgi:hypothetical protein
MRDYAVSVCCKKQRLSRSAPPALPKKKRPQGPLEGVQTHSNGRTAPARLRVCHEPAHRVPATPADRWQAGISGPCRGGAHGGGGGAHGGHGYRSTPPEAVHSRRGGRSTQAGEARSKRVGAVLHTPEAARSSHCWPPPPRPARQCPPTNSRHGLGCARASQQCQRHASRTGHGIERTGFRHGNLLFERGQPAKWTHLTGTQRTR